ncbi:hypothetical protein IW256_006318 [Actinomadura viridis]|uniref:Uncharacterized protein n=1 Tax=Actinomadura viridis TaxID=58110 RepID=A0A931DRR0_9ACTN|nr:hypothetical protein [Actinomadura viridis]
MNDVTLDAPAYRLTVKTDSLPGTGRLRRSSARS